MKKQIKKLTLSKRTILNLNTVEMNLKVGGAPGATFKCITEWQCTKHCPTQHGQTCNNNC